MIEEKLVDFILQLLATCIGAFLGYLGGLMILRREQEGDEKQKRERIKESLEIEINLHKKIILGRDINIGKEATFKKELPTFSFDGIIASGLYTHVPPEVQQIVSRHYQGCYKSNRYVHAGLAVMGGYDSEVQEMQRIIRQEIDDVLKKLKELS